jgi:uncharacterized lipoprotein
MKTESKTLLLLHVTVSFFIIILLNGCSTNSEYLEKRQDKINSLQSALNDRPIENNITEAESKDNTTLCINPAVTLTKGTAFMDHKKMTIQGGSIRE